MDRCCAMGSQMMGPPTTKDSLKCASRTNVVLGECEYHFAAIREFNLFRTKTNQNEITNNQFKKIIHLIWNNLRDRTEQPSPGDGLDKWKIAGKMKNKTDSWRILSEKFIDPGPGPIIYLKGTTRETIDAGVCRPISGSIAREHMLSRRTSARAWNCVSDNSIAEKRN